jgi:hypothetical protein
MPAVKRRLFNLLAAVSLVLCVAMTSTWASSYYREFSLLRHSDTRAWSLRLFRGRLDLRRVVFPQETLPAPLNGKEVYDPAPAPWRIFVYLADPPPRYGFAWLSSATDPIWFKSAQGIRSFWILRAPVGPMCIAVAIVAGCCVCALVRHARLPVKGCCRKCGYDLRATPHRCPECGAVPANVPAEAK